MSRFTARVTYHGRTVAKLKRLLFSRGIVPEFQSAFQKINEVYSRFIIDRFLKFSGGGGNWRKNAASTIARKGHGLILRDSDQMLSELEPQIVKADGVLSASSKVGFSIVSGASGTYKGGTTVEEVIRIHNEGKGRVAKRQILVGPDTNTAERMARITEQAIGDYLARK